MATPSTLILDSLFLIGEKAIDGTLTTGEQTGYLRKLNAMMESWSLNRLMCYQVVEESVALTASVGSLTIGSGGTFNTVRPNKIVQAFVRDTNSQDTQVKIINADAYNNIYSKTVDGSYPSYLYYDSAFVTSLGTIYLWPEPSSGLTLYISSWKQLQTFALISTTVVLPPGYERAIIYNFAIEVAGGFRAVSQEVAKIARDSKAALMNLNAPAGFLKMDLGLGRRSNILTGA